MTQQAITEQTGIVPAEASATSQPAEASAPIEVKPDTAPEAGSDTEQPEGTATASEATAAEGQTAAPAESAVSTDWQAEAQRWEAEAKRARSAQSASDKRLREFAAEVGREFATRDGGDPDTAAKAWQDKFDATGLQAMTVEIGDLIGKLPKETVNPVMVGMLRDRFDMAVESKSPARLERLRDDIAALTKQSNPPQAPAKPVTQPVADKPKKPLAQRSAEMSSESGPPGGAGVRVTNDNIDKLWVDFDRKYPNQPNPYDKQYDEYLHR